MVSTAALNTDIDSFLLLLPACTERLIANDPAFVELSLERMGENFALDDFVYAVSVNRTVRHICFSGTFVRELSPDQWRTALAAVGHLETLEEVQIWCSTIPVATLAEMLTSAKNLRKIYFFRVKLAGSQEDFMQLAEALREHLNLRDVRVGGFEIVTAAAAANPNNNNNGDRIAHNVDFDCVVEALALAPAMQVVSLQLSGARDQAPFSGEVLAKLFQSPTVTELYLSRLGLGHEHFGVVAEELVQVVNLRILDLFGNNISNEDIVLIANGLQKNVGLETLVLPCSDDDLSLESAVAISKALQVNTTLVNLNLPRGVLGDDGLLHIAEGLSVNKTLRKIEVDVSKDLGDKGRAAFLGMLEQNYKLERLVVGNAEKSIKEKVEYYMRLNGAGRGSLISKGTANRAEWVEMLISCSDDLDCLFYFTSMNPTLCQYANAQTTDVIITHEIKQVRRHTLHTCGPVLTTDEPKAAGRRASVF